MAKTARNSVSRSIVWVILLLLVVGLAGFGAVNFSGNIRAVGSVGDTPIPVARYARQMNQDMQALRQQTGVDVNFQQFTALGLDRAALGKVITQVAIEDEAARIGLSVGDAEVQKALVQVPDFQGFDGKFDAEGYRDVLKRSGQTVSDFEDQLRAEGARRLLGSSVALGTNMPANYSDLIYAWAGERRSFTWLELTADDLSEPVREPSEDDLTAWYEGHQDLYTLPEAKAITYAWITPSMLAGKIDIDEQALRDLYESRASQYKRPETRLVERLVFGSADEAQAAWDRLQSGEIDFDALVEERKLTLDDIDMGDVTKAQLGAAGDAVFALTEPGLVGPVETDLGPAIIRMNGILAAEETSFEEVRDELVDEYATDRARRMIGDMMEQVNDLLAGGATLEELADETELELGKVDYSDAVSEGIAGYGAFRSAAEAAQDGDFPKAVALDDGGIFALRLDGIVPARVEPFEEVRDRVIADWETNEVKTALAALADELLPRIASGEDPESFGLAVNREVALTRDAFLADVPEGMVETVFKLAPGTAQKIDGTAGTSTVAIVRTDEVLPPDPDNTELAAARDAYARQVNLDLGNDLLQAFAAAIEASAGIKLDSAAVNAVNANFR